MTTALAVARYYLGKVNSDPDSGEGISNLKMQKLVYYAQAFHLAVFGTPLFDDAIMAWQHGPVVPDLYHEFKGYGSGPVAEITCTDDVLVDLSKDEIELLDEVYNHYAQFSAWRLREMTHAEDPWVDTYHGSSAEIPHEAMANFYSKYVVDEG